MQQVQAPALPVDPVPGRRVSRRGLFAAAAGLWAARPLVAPPAHAKDASTDPDPGSLLQKLVRRVTMGLNEAELALATSLGYEGYLERHLDYTAIDDSASEGALASLTTLTMTPTQLFATPAGQVVNELTEAAIKRSVFSTHQLFQRMVEFWTDHFNIDINNGDDRYLKTVDDRDVIRTHALGSFPALLSASAHSPAMLLYLDNNVSSALAPNENYSRELMELHTMGTDGGYTQQDVHEVARCFTGWTFYGRNQGTNTGTFRYNAANHDNGQKTVLGNIIPPGGGMNDGVTVLNILANHPSTARFVAKKLCRWLLQENPPAGVVADVAATYTATAGDIKAMIRAALSPGFLYDATPRLKRPYHHFISAMRALPTTLTSTSGVRSQLSGAGQLPFAWPTPDGYPDLLDYWSGLVLPRWNFGATLMNGNIAGASVNSDAFFAGLTTAQQCADRIDVALFGGEMDPADKDRVRQYMLPDPPSSSRRREAIGLAIGSPSFQWY